MKKSASKNSHKNRSAQKNVRGNMNPHKFHMEQLEPRHLLSSVPLATGMIGNSFQDEATLTITAENTDENRSVIVELHVESASGSLLDPGSMTLSSSSENSPILYQNANFEGTSAFMIAKLILNQEYTLHISSEGETTGDYNIYVFMPGDINSDGILSESEYARAEAAVYQTDGFSSGLARVFFDTYGYDLYRENFYSPNLDINGNKKVDSEELIQLMYDNYQLTSSSEITITPTVITDNEAPQVINPAILNSTGESLDAFSGENNTWDGPWSDTQNSDLITSTVTGATGFLLTGTLYDKTEISSATGKLSWNDGSHKFNMCENGSFNTDTYYTYDSTTGSFSLDIIKILKNENLDLTDGVPEGEYTLKVWGADSYNNQNTESTAQEIKIVVDRTPPAVTPGTITGMSGITKENSEDLTVSLSGTYASGEYLQLWRRTTTQENSAATLVSSILITDDMCNDGSYTFKNISLKNLMDGEYVFLVRTADVAGNINPTIASTNIKIDRTAPVITVDLTASATPETYPGTDNFTGLYTHDTTTDLTISATDSTNLTYTLLIDGNSNSSYTPTNGSFTNVPLLYGDNTFQVILTDESGNTTESSIITIRQNTPPAVKMGASDQVILQNSTNTWSLDITNLFSDSDASTDTLLPGRYSAEYTSDAILSAAFQENGGSLFLNITFNSIPENSTLLESTLRLTYTDAYGEAVSDTLNVIYTKDNAAPTLTNVSISPATDITNNNPFLTKGDSGNFTINAQVFDTTGILELYAKITGPDSLSSGNINLMDTTLYDTNSAERSLNVRTLLGRSDTELLPDGDYTLTVWGTDTLGNSSTSDDPSDKFTFTLDSTAPTPLTGISVSRFTKDTTPEVTINLPEVDETETANLWVELSVYSVHENGETLVTTQRVTYNSLSENNNNKLTITGAEGVDLSEGEYTLKAYMMDQAGNTSASVTGTVTVDTTAPNISSLEVSGVTEGSTENALANFTVTLEGTGPGSVNYYLTLPGEETPSRSETNTTDVKYTFTDVPLTYGTQTYTLRVTDAAGNEANQTITITQNKTPEYVYDGKLNTTHSSTAGTTKVISFPSTYFFDENPDELTITASASSSNNLATATYNSTTGEITVNFSEFPNSVNTEIITIEVTATDEFGKTASTNFNITYIRVNTAPTWNSAAESPTFTPGTEGEINLLDYITDAETPNGLSFSNVSITFGKDNAGNDTIYTLTPKADNPSVYTWTPPAGYYGYGVLTVTATDQSIGSGDGQAEKIVTFDNKEIIVSWVNAAPTITLKEEAASVKISQVDSDDTTDRTISLTDYFTITNNDGTFVKPDGTTYVDPAPTQTLTFALSDSFTESPLFVQDSVSLNANDGTLHYKLSALAYGSTSIPFTVSDGSASTSATLPFTVLPVSHAPTGSAVKCSFQLNAESMVQSFDLLTLGNVTDLDVGQTLSVTSVTLGTGENPPELDSTNSSASLTVNGVSVTFTLNKNSLQVTVPEGTDLEDLKDQSVNFSFTVADDGALPTGATEWSDGIKEARTPTEITISGNTCAFNTYAVSDTFNITVNASGKASAPVSIDILAESRETWGELQFTLTGGPYNIYPENSVTPAGTATINNDGTVTIDLPASAHGTYTFEFTITEATTNITASATITLNVTGVNYESPEFETGKSATDLANFTVKENESLTITKADLDAIFTDYETPDALTYALALTDATKGTISGPDGDGNFTFTPSAGVFDESVAFTVTVTDATVGEDPANVTVFTGSIFVQADYTVALKTSLSATTNEDASVKIYLSEFIANTPTDGEVTYTYAINGITPVAGVYTLLHGTLTLAGGTATYTPVKDYFGTDSFEFTVTAVRGTSEPSESSATGEVSITINSVNDDPSFDFDENSAGLTIKENGDASILLSGDTATVNVKNISAGPNESEECTFSISSSISSHSDAPFTAGINSLTGEITITKTSAMAGGVFTLAVTISDGELKLTRNLEIAMAISVQIEDDSLKLVEGTETVTLAAITRITVPYYLTNELSVTSFILATGSLLKSGQELPNTETIKNALPEDSYTETDGSTLTLKEDVVLASGIQITNTTLLSGTKLATDSMNLDFVTPLSATIKTFSLNPDYYNTADIDNFVAAPLIHTTDNFGASIASITAPDLTNTFINSVSINADKQSLNISYKVYSPSISREPVTITVTTENGTEIPVIISIDHEESVQYFFRIVTSEGETIQDTTVYGTADFLDSISKSTFTVTEGTTVHVELWAQYSLPLYYPGLPSFSTITTTHGVNVNGSYDETFTSTDLSFTHPISGSTNAGGYGTLGGDQVLTIVDDTTKTFIIGTGKGIILAGGIFIPGEYLGSSLNQEYVKIMGGLEITPTGTGTIQLNMGLSLNDKGEFINTLYYLNNSNTVIGGIFTPAQLSLPELEIKVIPSTTPLLGTASARETTVEGTGVYMTLSKTEESPFQTEALPENEQWITEWDTHYVNLWVNTQDENVQLDKVLFDLQYNSEYFTATEVQYTDAIRGLNYKISDADGTIYGLGGKLTEQLTTEEGFILIGRVKMESLAEDNLASDTVGSVKTGLALDDILLTSADGETITPNTNVYVNTAVFPVVYDADDSGKIDVFDLTKFLSYYGSTSLDSLDPTVWALDFDNSGKLNIFDMLSFLKNYGARKDSTQEIIYPEGFMQQWIGTTLLTDDATNLSNMLENVIYRWQDALGEQFNLDVQIITKNLDGNVLGESVIVSTDENGRPDCAVIYLDSDALGKGWYINETDTWLAESDRYDLYTVLAHELGHALGLNPAYEGYLSVINTSEKHYVDSQGTLHLLSGDLQHVENTEDLMYYQLDPGVRKEISTLDAEILIAARAAGGNVLNTQNIPLTGQTQPTFLLPTLEGITSSADASSIVDAQEWTNTLETQVRRELQRVTGQLTAAVLESEEETPDFAAFTQADTRLWEDLLTDGTLNLASSTSSHSAESAKDHLMENWESLFHDDAEEDEIPLTLIQE
ncbi:MAG: cadherin-like domain-containing protein [Planctomycetia bacterium]|nr:cadherin-like domain-containing protein [Planctomycetia bacterium]